VGTLQLDRCLDTAQYCKTAATEWLFWDAFNDAGKVCWSRRRSVCVCLTLWLLPCCMWLQLRPS